MGPKSRRAGVRATIVAKKCRNGHGAKGRRKLDMTKTQQRQEASAAKLFASPASVVRESGTKQAGETQRPQAATIAMRWPWVEASVWNGRMLTALEKGVKGGLWFSLIDKVYNRQNLYSAWSKVARNKGSAGIDGITIEDYQRDVEANVAYLTQRLKTGDYQPKAVRRVEIPKGDGKMRPLGIPTVSDRVVQGAIRHVIEPIFEQQFAQHSYGFRPGRGCKDALRRVDQLLKSGYEYVVDADLKSYFDTIPHDRLMQEMQKSISDGRLLKVIESFLHANIMEGLSSWKPTAGAPQGAVLSPLLSNIYLNALDHLMVKHGLEMVRYADDFVILCRSAQEAHAALKMVQTWTAEAGLTLHPEKTRIVHAASESFDFLGYRFDKGIKYPRPKSLMKLRDAIRDKTRRTHGHQLEASIASINRVLRGWFGYFQHSYRTTFPTIDSWIRMRLRSILRKRRGGRGRGRGRDHQRWPNAYFKDLGLYSLVQAHRLACESLKGAQQPESRMR